jgi:hypothetical protein
MAGRLAAPQLSTFCDGATGELRDRDTFVASGGLISQGLR